MTHIGLATMPVAERIRLMETLWDSLNSEEAAAAVVPDWHREVPRYVANYWTGTKSRYPHWKMRSNGSHETPEKMTLQSSSMNLIIQQKIEPGPFVLTQ